MTTLTFKMQKKPFFRTLGVPSQELRMLSTVTLNFQVTMIVMNLASLLSKLKPVSQLSQVHFTVHSWALGPDCPGPDCSLFRGGQLGPGAPNNWAPAVGSPTVHFSRADSLAPDRWPPRLICPGPNCPLFVGGQLDPGAQLSGAQLSGAQNA